MTPCESRWCERGDSNPHGFTRQILSLVCLRKTRYRGLRRVQMHAYLVAAAYNLLRIVRLAPAPA